MHQETETHWELYDDSNRKTSWKETLFFVVCFLMAGFGLYQMVKETPVAAVNNAQELSVGSAAQFEPEYKLGAATKVVPHCDMEWTEIRIAKKSGSPSVADILEHDVFDKFDLNGDGDIDASEMRRLLESGTYQVLNGLTVADMKMMKRRLKYPVLRVTQDMPEKTVDAVCATVFSMEGESPAEEFGRKFGDDPKLLMASMIEEMDTVLAEKADAIHMNFEGFKDSVEKDVKKQETSDSLMIPSECKDRRRRLRVGPKKMNAYDYLVMVQRWGNWFDIIPDEVNDFTDTISNFGDSIVSEIGGLFGRRQ